MIKITWTLFDEDAESLKESDFESDEELAIRLMSWLRSQIPKGILNKNLTRQPKYNVGDCAYTVDFAYAENIDGKLVKRYQVNAGKITRIYCGKSKSTYYLTSCRNGRQERELYRNRFDAEDKKKELEKI